MFGWFWNIAFWVCLVIEKMWERKRYIGGSWLMRQCRKCRVIKCFFIRCIDHLWHNCAIAKSESRTELELASSSLGMHQSSSSWCRLRFAIFWCWKNHEIWLGLPKSQVPILRLYMLTLLGFCLHLNFVVFTFLKKLKRHGTTFFTFINESLFFKASNIPFPTTFSFRDTNLISL